MSDSIQYGSIQDGSNKDGSNKDDSVKGDSVQIRLRYIVSLWKFIIEPLRYLRKIAEINNN